jgi:flagella basal body P-ring formation protein FlgA
VVEKSVLQNNVFKCLITFPNFNKSFAIQAIVKQLIKVPTLRRLILSNEKISEEDIQWEEVEIEKISASSVLLAEDLVGRSPVGQPLHPHEIIKKSALKRPKAVRKGDLVTLKLQTPYMVLIHRKTQAMEDGMLGDSIKVCNLDTKRIVVGIVKENGIIEVPYGTH